MKRHPHSQDDSLESDAVWKLLDQAASRAAGPRFVDDAVRAARLSGQAAPGWWGRLWIPVSLAGVTAAAAAMVVAFVSLSQNAPVGGVAGSPIIQDPSPQNPFAELQELAEEETLSAAVDHLDDFTDSELVCLIGL
ncbi:MAG: hypothetical protein K9N23_01625 [Akkermansiaceae bacterium]|nr:hypothetical protein [Akkermansiaceae bacterium]MCF7730349.1 hypothetical protein [Akkermansiaceae bacterium]